MWHPQLTVVCVHMPHGPVINAQNCRQCQLASTHEWHHQGRSPAARAWCGTIGHIRITYQICLDECPLCLIASSSSEHLLHGLCPTLRKPNQSEDPQASRLNSASYLALQLWSSASAHLCQSSSQALCLAKETDQVLSCNQLMLHNGGECSADVYSLCFEKSLL